MQSLTFPLNGACSDQIDILSLNLMRCLTGTFHLVTFGVSVADEMFSPATS